MKKIIAILLSLCLVFALAACGNGDTTTGDNNSAPPAGGGNTPSGGGSTTTSPSASVPTDTNPDVEDFVPGEISINKDDLPHFKIAFGYGDWESVLGTQFMKAIEYLCDAFNCEPVFYGAGTGEEGVANVESLLAAGDIDGIISVGWDTARMDVANRHGVPVVTACQFPTVREISGITAYDGFLGGVVDDEVWAGYHAMKALYDSGSRNVTWSGLTTGYNQGHDDRTTGAKQFVEGQSGINLLADSYTVGRWHEDIPTFVAAFSEMDGMCFTALSDAVYTVMAAEGIDDGSVKVAGPDVASMTGEFFNKGIQVWSCGGQYATAMISWAILYNHLIDGTVILSNPSEPLSRNYLEITSYEDFVQYEEIINSSTPAYTALEIAELIHFFNSDVTYGDYVALGQNYSLDDITARHSS